MIILPTIFDQNKSSQILNIIHIQDKKDEAGFLLYIKIKDPTQSRVF
ncbi:hypothetical protein ACI8B_310024 [Acinetobacter proteolyticus]|uniref:Uncharacterized protein n=1 Tax=Acinetobacter proteolyticus TaxID=1776741 RepID=A0A653K8I0_9GAMM|nr:hypothetical protein ACI8B_310024 [Acinetobacter proteolyticus]